MPESNRIFQMYFVLDVSRCIRRSLIRTWANLGANQFGFWLFFELDFDLNFDLYLDNRIR